MLRPATPLTILLFAAFVLLLISVISTPIIQAIPLASYSGVNFGVFGYCQDGKCSKIEIGYNTANLFDTDQNGSFDLPINTRTTLSSILVLHPIAAFFVLIMLILAATSHAHSPSHSPRYLLGMFILSILTLLLTLLSFLIDVLLFAPHMAWGSYLVLAATILVAAGGLVSCAMRRTLVSRKARAKRIAENAEMNGENFYARQATETVAPLPLTLPIVNGGPGADKLPSFATFEMANQEKGRTSDGDERIPLTARTPTDRSPAAGAATLNGGPDDPYGGQQRMGGAPGMNNGRFNGPPQRDEYGNIIPPQAAYGQPGIRRDPSQDRMRGGYGDGNFRGRGGPPGGYRGRGGPGYGRGGFNPNMRGGYGPAGPGRGGPNGMMGPMAAGAMMRGGRGQPPGYPNGNGAMYRGESPGGSYGPSGRRPAPGPVGGMGYGDEPYGAYNGGDNRDSLPRAESPPPMPEIDGSGPVGQAVEMGATTRSPSHAPQGFGNNFGVRDSDSDIAGIVGLQQQRANMNHDTMLSDGSRYSNDVPDGYVPPRQGWTDQGQAGRSLPLRSGSRAQGAISPHSPTHRRRSSGDHYYDDVEPRFAEPLHPTPELQAIPPSHIPPALTPGYTAPLANPSTSTVQRDPTHYLQPSSSNPALNHSNSYEDIQEGSRSPAESDRSNFTSVSQRGVNPRWNPAMGPGGFGAPMNNRRPVPPPTQRNEILLNSNPDFELPGARPGRGPSREAGQRRPLPGGMVPRSAYDGGTAIHVPAHSCIGKKAIPSRFTPFSFPRAPHPLSHQLRRQIQTQQFQPFVPPSPASLGKAAPPKLYRRTRRWGRVLIYLAAGIGSIYVIDNQFYASSLTRSFRTFGLGLVVALDYKLNFRPKPWLGGTISDLHRRNAERLFDLLRTNGGLYLKIGQAIAMQSAVMPPEFQRMFARMFDDAPQNDWKDVEKVIREDFGKSPEEVFGVSFTGEPGKGVMERTARASASVAQVHWARLADGREVAIKVQKREIAQQVGWDLWAFKVVMKVYTTWFDLPLYSLVPYITQRLMLETDFENEANNSERMAQLVASEPRLNGRVYIPKVYHDLSSKRVMTAEWIEGVRLWDKASLAAPWLGGRGKGSPGVHGAPLDSPNVIETLRNHPNAEKLKPDRSYWKGPQGKGGLGLSLKEVMTTMIDLFSAQMFLWGFVHCDPHPGNIFIRRLPNGHSELVLIDHGLYVSMTPAFRHQYCLFWKSLMTFDNATLAEITKEWGVNSPDMFASATLMKPYEGGDGSTKARVMDELSGATPAERSYEAQQRMFQGVRDVLGDESKWPRELIFIGRNMRIVQGNNQFLGSPVNRVKMTGAWASRSLVDSPDLTYRERFTNGWRHLIFKFVLFTSDVVFYTSKVRQWLGLGGGMEDDMEKQMRVIAKDTFGVELQHSVFEG